MKSHQFVWALALYTFLIGFVGYFRTGSAVPILITGVIAVITGLLATLLYQKVNGAKIVTLLWLAASVCLYGYMTFFRVAAHANPRSGQPIIFGSMALFTLLAFVVVVRSKK
jgi:hypothetical protein